MFNWFFAGRGKSLFDGFISELQSMNSISTVLDEYLEGKDVEHRREHIAAVNNKLREKLKPLTHRISSQRDTLRLYISSSIEGHDYLSKIYLIIKNILSGLSDIDVALKEKDPADFIERVEEANKSIHQDIDALRLAASKFYTQSKGSLEWNYSAHKRNVDLSEFIKKVKMLGGYIDPSIGKGGHFGVVFRLFINIIGTSKKMNKQISKGTLAAFLKQKESQISKAVPLRYLECYFFNNNQFL